MNKLSFSPSIDLIIGPMYSSKTTELIRRLVIYNETGMNVLYINSELDNRTQESFSSHNSTINTIPFDSVKLKSLEYDISKYDVIGIDEGQLFSNLKDTVLKWVEKMNKIVIIAGLNGDYRRQEFGEILQLIPYCDSITKLTSFCIPCKKNNNTIKPAHFTKRTVDSTDTVLIGGKNLYVPTCRECFKLDK